MRRIEDEGKWINMTYKNTFRLTKWSNDQHQSELKSSHAGFEPIVLKETFMGEILTIFMWLLYRENVLDNLETLSLQLEPENVLLWNRLEHQNPEIFLP